MISQQQYNKILKILADLYPNAHTELIYHNGFELLIAVILSAQTTDKSVNKVTPILFEHYPKVQSLAEADLSDVEKIISSIGLYHNKSKNIIRTAQIIHQEFNDQIPKDKKNLLKLPGVGEKTASVVLGDYFKIPAFAVDTHIERLSKRWDLVSEDAKVSDVQRILMKMTPKEQWVQYHHRMIIFGRYFCTARNPKCENCKLLSLCKFGKNRLNIK